MTAALVFPISALGAEPSHAALAAAARQAALQTLDGPYQYCDSGTPIETWLKKLVGTYARRITWTGGQCRIVDARNPLDTAAWPYCAQATVMLAHPKSRQDRPMIEIFLERPKGGHPGAVYAFRSVMMTRDDGPDLLRNRKDFEAEWNERFPPPPEAAPCKDD